MIKKDPMTQLIQPCKGGIERRPDGTSEPTGQIVGTSRMGLDFKSSVVATK